MVKVYTEVTSAYDFDFWSGAVDTANCLDDAEIEQVFDYLDSIQPDGMTATELNDFFWFEDDAIADLLGWDDFETLMKARSGGNWFDTQEEYEESLEEDEEDDEE